MTWFVPSLPRSQATAANWGKSERHSTLKGRTASLKFQMLSLIKVPSTQQENTSELLPDPSQQGTPTNNHLVQENERLPHAMRIIQGWPSNEALYFIYSNNHTILTPAISLSISKYQRLVAEAPSARRGMHFSCTACMSCYLDWDSSMAVTRDRRPVHVSATMPRADRIPYICFFQRNSSGWTSSEAKPNFIESESRAANP